VHDDAPVVSALKRPAVQAVHTSDVVGPAAPPYRPAAQAVQDDVPVVSRL